MKRSPACFSATETASLISVAIIEKINIEDRASTASSYSPFLLTGTLGKHAHLDVSGAFELFGADPNIELSGHLEALELPALSPYMIRRFGFELTSGLIDGEVKLRIARDGPRGEIDVHLRGIDVGTVDKEKLALLEKEIPVSLNKAIRLLREDDGSIKMVIPVGPDSLASGTFGLKVDRAINRALGQAAIWGLLLTNPVTGFIAAAVSGESGKGNKIHPVAFAAGTATLDSAAAAYLKRVATLMIGQPQVDVRVCGVSVEADQAVLSDNATEASTEALLSLAEQRTTAVRDYLIVALGAEANRVIPCLPAFEEGKPGRKPRADLEVLGKLGPRAQSK